jgi:hypothetical protein
MSFDALALLLPCQSVKDLAQLPAQLPEQDLAPSFRTTHIMHTFLKSPPFTIDGIPSLENLSVL